MVDITLHGTDGQEIKFDSHYMLVLDCFNPDVARWSIEGTIVEMRLELEKVEKDSKNANATIRLTDGNQLHVKETVLEVAQKVQAKLAAESEAFFELLKEKGLIHGFNVKSDSTEHESDSTSQQHSSRKPQR